MIPDKRYAHFCILEAREHAKTINALKSSESLENLVVRLRCLDRMGNIAKDIKVKTHYPPKAENILNYVNQNRAKFKSDLNQAKQALQSKLF